MTNRHLLVAAAVQLGGWLLVGVALLGLRHAGRVHDPTVWRLLGGLGLVVALAAFLAGFAVRARQIRSRSPRRLSRR